MTEPQRVFWADEVADEIEAREPDEPIVIKGGISPSGVPHLGNANEIVLGHFVAEVLRERGWAVEQVFTTDDRDPLRSLPRTLATEDGDLVSLGDVDAGALGRNLGAPYTGIPNPFDSPYDSYGDHFSALIERSAVALDIELELVSTTELYESGRMDEAIRTVLARRDVAMELLAEFQDHVDLDDVPFTPICANCGKLTTTVTDVDLADESVTYACTELRAGDQTIEGCGHEDVADLHEGKLPWRFEWVAQWAVLGVDFEPFGKDHAEGSWPSGKAIAERIFEIDPPVPFVYEWFTLDGEPFSSSSGHVVMVEDVLRFVDPAVLRYFFARDPSRAHDLSIERIDQLVDEFDRFEAIYFDEVEATASETERAERIYPFLVEAVRPERVRIPYRFAAVLGMTDDPAERERIARAEGHVPADAPDWAIAEALERVDRARTWAAHVDNEYNYEIHRESIPHVEIDAATDAALGEVADVLAAGADGETVQGAIYEAARDHDVPVADLFATGYRLFLGRSDGPKLGPLLAKLDRDFAVARLRREA